LQQADSTFQDSLTTAILVDFVDSGKNPVLSSVNTMSPVAEALPQELEWVSEWALE
jgi:hypothetical protein